jgi:ABC-type nitrate/sulfonate/bicarbonate transport system substrate-binding protein
MKRGLLFFGLILWTVFSTAAVTAAEVQKLKIIYSSFTGAYTPLWIAVDEQLGRKHGLDLEAVYAGRARPHQLLLSGDATCRVDRHWRHSSYAVGQDMVIIASFLNVTGSSLFTKPQISKPADLRGKVVGSGRPGSITDVMLHYVLKRKLNLDPGRDVKVVPLGDGPSILPALEKGVVDGAVLTTPTRLMAKRMGFREMLDFDELGIPYPYVGVSTLKVTVKKRPEVTMSFIRTLTEGIQVFKPTGKSDGGDEEIFTRRKRRFSRKLTTTSAPRFKRRPLLRRRRQTALDMMSDQFPQAKSVDPNEVIDLSFIR